jgi:hypothetical protein
MHSQIDALAGTVTVRLRLMSNLHATGLTAAITSRVPSTRVHRFLYRYVRLKPDISKCVALTQSGQLSYVPNRICAQAL